MRSLLATAIAALAFAVAPLAHAQEGKLKVGAAPPEGFAEHLEFVKGEPVTSFAEDKVYVVEFWATWCAPCKRSIPHLTELQRDYGSKGLQIIGISDEPVDTVKKFVTEKGSSMDYTVATQKKDDSHISMAWMKAAGQNGIPCAFILNRSKKLVFIGNPLDPAFDRALKLTLANRYDPELMSRVEPTISAARASAKRRNYKEAAGLYAKAIAEGPSTLLEYSFECWRMMGEQANDDAGAKAYIRKTIDDLSKDRYSLIEAATYLAADPSIKKRDLDAAKYAAEKLKAISGSSEDPDSLAALAAVAAAGGDYAGAAEMQYDAMMAAVPTAKPAFKRTLEVYESKSKSGASAK
jgi:thiol-disulfide isomerase/thioredoxin